MPSSPSSHEASAAELARERPIHCAVLTVSDTRTIETDTCGPTIARLLESAAMQVADRRIVPDDPGAIRQALLAWLARPDIDAIITTGGTGIAKRDGTVDVVRHLLSVELEGFGELFRMVSWNEVGAAAMLSRAVGGLVFDNESGAKQDTFIFALPGSLNAVETAMNKLIVPQLAHLVWERRR